MDDYVQNNRVVNVMRRLSYQLVPGYQEADASAARWAQPGASRIGSADVYASTSESGKYYETVTRPDGRVVPIPPREDYQKAQLYLGSDTFVSQDVAMNDVLPENVPYGQLMYPPPPPAPFFKPTLSPVSSRSAVPTTAALTQTNMDLSSPQAGFERTICGSVGKFVASSFARSTGSGFTVARAYHPERSINRRLYLLDSRISVPPLGKVRICHQARKLLRRRLNPSGGQRQLGHQTVQRIRRWFSFSQQHDRGYQAMTESSEAHADTGWQYPRQREREESQKQQRRCEIHVGWYDSSDVDEDERRRPVASPQTRRALPVLSQKNYNVA